MKKNALLLCALVVALSSCSPDNSDDTPTPSNYLPLTDASYWTYDVTGTAEGTSGRDSIYVANDTVINTLTYKKIKARTPRVGFYANLMHQAALRKTGSKVLATGTNSFSFAGEVPINLAVTDFVVFDSDASENTVLDSESGTNTQTVNNIPLTLNYTISSKAGARYPTWTDSQGTVYQDVTVSKYIISLKVTAQFEGVPFPITVLDTQDVLVSNLFYAADIGVVTANTNIQYQLQDFSALGITLPIPQNGSESMLEVLDTFQIAN